MGLKPQALRYIWQAIEDSFGEGALDRIEFGGLDFDEAAKIFSTRVFGRRS
jgi:hypothetical protein